MKKNLIILSLSLLCSSCLKFTRSTDDVSIPSFEHQLANSSTFKEYMRTDQIVFTGLIADKYNFHNVNMNVIHANKAVLTRKQLTELYTKAGMDSAEDYLYYTLRSSVMLARLKREIHFPNLNNHELVMLYRKVYFDQMHSPKPDYAALSKRRKIKQIERTQSQLF